MYLISTQITAAVGDLVRIGIPIFSPLPTPVSILSKQIKLIQAYINYLHDYHSNGGETPVCNIPTHQHSSWCPSLHHDPKLPSNEYHKGAQGLEDLYLTNRE